MRAGSLVDFISQMKASWSYEPLSLAQLNALTATTRALDHGDLARAKMAAAQSGYEILPLGVDEGCYVMARPTDAAPKGQGILVFATHWARDLVIEAPHAYEDRHSDVEAAQLFVAVQAKALIVSGAHRCVLRSSSGCHASSECDKTSLIPAESDPSHSVYNTVNAVHLGFRTTEAVIVQLHTNLCPDLNGEALVSNGTHYAIAGTIADALYQALRAPDVDVRSCNVKDASPTGATCRTVSDRDAGDAGDAGNAGFVLTKPFCGETSTQSLSSNGAADACLGRANQNGGAAAHRFIHLEQWNWRMCLDRSQDPKCVDTVAEWTARVANALAAAYDRTH